MTCYWARFENQNGNIFRLDTRIYLLPIMKPSNADDICIGAVIGKNPGSAQPTDFNKSTLQPIQLNNDNFLPTVRNIIIQAHAKAKIGINNNEYIQVLNLFYLCDKNLKAAKRRINKLSDHPKCCSENSKFNFIFYFWGGPNDGINRYKNRFLDNPRTDNHIWFDYESQKIKKSMPCENDFVKHTQGLTHGLIVPDIAKILKKNNL